MSSNPSPQEDHEERLRRQPIRSLRAWERVVLAKLCEMAGLPDAITSESALDAYRVREMLDGGMGSIRFATPDDERHCGQCSVAELWFSDSDGTPVSVALNLDDRGEPWEIDCWKVDFSPLLRPPEATDLKAAKQDVAVLSPPAAGHRT